MYLLSTVSFWHGMGKANLNKRKIIKVVIVGAICHLLVK